MIKSKIIISSIASVILFQASNAMSEEKWDMALAYSATNYHSEIAKEFADNVTKATNGELTITTHPGGSLFSGEEIFKAVRKGLTPIGERLISALGNEDPLFEIDSVPFLATSFDSSRKLYEVSKPALEKKLDEKNLVLLYSAPWPPQGFYSVKESNSKEDLAGLKFRAYNATTSKIAELLGMIPAKIEAAELSQAFATGVAESMISSGSTGYDRKLWEHVNYFYEVNAWLPRNMVIVNKKAWNKLDESTQAILRAEAASAETKAWDKAEELTNWYVEQFKANGMTVGPAGDALQADFEAAGKVLLDEWLAKSGDEGKALIDAYNAQ